ncbi:hypothetical protein AURDEDRAFT_133193 [Auricularia subglabra TFB-10046 SS5]|nr:hypothetical protein AURDEDRAFT_133193 [Auricularia subglabra TFB-10046 SS5]
MYHDKRFQLDSEFALIAFNQEQILAGSKAGVFLSSKRKFQRLADMLGSIDESVFGELANKLQSDPHWKPRTEVESKCFKILGELDMVNAHVPGSVAAKKYQRNELWSLLSYMGAPTWFITFAPADIHHPLCLYYADSSDCFDEKKISLLPDDTKWRLVANNPIASARFFHFIVSIFIEEIICWGRENPGLFGETNAFYGTVEQQVCLWICFPNSLWKWLIGLHTFAVQ